MAINNLRQKNIFDGYGMNVDYLGGGSSPSFIEDDQNFGRGPTQAPDPSTYQPIPVNDPRAPNIFAQMQSVDMGGAPKPLQNPEDEWLQKLRELDKPETAATARFEALLNRVPQRESPGWGRTLTAIATGLGSGDVEKGQKVIDRPFDQDFAAWKDEATPVYQAANLERQSNAQERTLLSQGINSQIAQRRIDEAQRKAEADLAERTRSNKANEDIRMIHAKAADLRARGYKTFIDGNRIKASNAMGELIDLGPSTGMTKYDEIMLRGELNIEANRVQGSAAAGRVVQAGADRQVDEQGNSYSVNPRADGGQDIKPMGNAPPKPVGTLRSPGTAPPPPNPMQQKLINAENEKQMYNNLPQYRILFKRSSDGSVIMIPRPPGFTDPRATLWDEAKKLLDPTYKAPIMPAEGAGQGRVPYREGLRPEKPGLGPSSPPVNKYEEEKGGGPEAAYTPPSSFTPAITPQAAPPPPPEANAQIIYEGEVKVRNKQTGRVSAMPAANVQRALATGVYEVVR